MISPVHYTAGYNCGVANLRHDVNLNQSLLTSPVVPIPDFTIVCNSKILSGVLIQSFYPVHICLANAKDPLPPRLET